MQRFSDIGSDLLSNGYQKAVFLELECVKHGACRLGISREQALGERYACPECQHLSPCSGVMSSGYTRRPLPISEFWHGRGHWDFRAD
jgi:hypothetical protein